MTQSTLNVSSVVQRYRSELFSIYPVREIEQFIALVFDDVMHFSKIEIFMNGDTLVSTVHLALFETVLEGLKEQQPIQYLLGQTVFYGLPMRVNPDVLIPRPETEELVHWILKDELKKYPRVIDLGTGSGCIALALKDQLEEAKVYGVDNSVAALNIAMENARRNELEVEFFHFDILSKESLEFMNFDLMVSNPPYVTQQDRRFMSPNVLDNEPHSALFVYHDDPLIFYRKIVDLAEGHLNRSGKLYFEINEAFGNEILQFLKDRGFVHVEMKKDFNGRDRMIRGTKP